MEPEPVDLSGLSSRCGGTGYLTCRCMGDGCCCGFHSYAECYGCPDCEGSDDDYDLFEPEEDAGALPWEGRP